MCCCRRERSFPRDWNSRSSNRHLERRYGRTAISHGPASCWPARQRTDFRGPIGKSLGERGVHAPGPHLQVDALITSAGSFDALWWAGTGCGNRERSLPVPGKQSLEERSPSEAAEVTIG